MGNLLTSLNENPKVFVKYNWKRDLPDKRDIYIKFNNESEQETVENYDIPQIDLRKKFPPVYDQGKLGSCTANALAGIFEYNECQKEEDYDIPSRLFIYYNERAYEGTTQSDSGASLRDGIKSLNKIGVCPEENWPYDISYFCIRPTQECYDIAKRYKALAYNRVEQTLDCLKRCLIENYPIVCGIMIYTSFESEDVSNNGQVKLPESHESLLGGHAIILVGYDDEKENFIFRNSWGQTWGDNGYGYIPYSYITDKELASDFWIITKELLPDLDSESESESESDSNSNSESGSESEKKNDDE